MTMNTEENNSGKEEAERSGIKRYGEQDHI